MKLQPCGLPCVAAVFLLALSLPQSALGQASEDPYILEMGVPFATTDIDPLTMNIASPKAAGQHPCIVYVGWGGVASYDTATAIAAAEKGCVGVVIDYRRNARFPVPVSDVKKALSFLAANAARYRLDPKRIALAGFHFGGYLALLAAYTTETEVPTGAAGAKAGNYSVRAVIALGSPTDWRRVDDPTYYATLRGGETPEAFFAHANVLGYVDAKDPPTLIFHGEIDKDTQAKNAQLLDETLREKGVPHRLFLLKDVDVHVMDRWQSHEAWEFLAAYLQ